MKEMSAAGIRAAKQIAIEAAKGCALVSFILFSIIVVFSLRSSIPFS